MRVGGKDYSADVLIGTKPDDSLVFYDLINFTPIKINERAPVMRTMNQNDSTTSLVWDTPSDNSISQTVENNNPYLQKNVSNLTTESRDVLFDEVVRMGQENADNGQAERRDASGELGDVGNTQRTGETENRMLGALTRVANALGYRVIQTPRQDVMEGAGISSDVDGYVDKNRKEIYINPNAREPLSVVMKHEITHVLENVSDTYLTKARDYIKSALPGLWEETQARVQEKYDRLGIDATGRLESETMAEIAETLSTDEAILRYGTSEKVTRNIAMWFSYMAKKVKSVFGDLSVQEKLEVAAYKWEQALRKAEKQQAGSLQRPRMETGDVVRRSGNGTKLERSQRVGTELQTKETEAAFTKMTAQTDGGSLAVTSVSKGSAPQRNRTVNSVHPFAQNGKKDADINFLFAGEKAKTKDPAALDKAKRLSVLGETPQQIWKETGWVKGLEGKWRFELDDSKMKFKKKNGKISDIFRVDFMNMPMQMGDTVFHNWMRLMRDDGLEAEKATKIISALEKGEPVEMADTLENVISYRDLFDAYPELRDVQVKADFDTYAVNEARYSEPDNTIYVGPHESSEEVRKSVLHEVMHILQFKEKFAIGSSPFFWELVEGVLPEEAARLYENTAGEIEARDVEKRAGLTKAERRNTFPESAVSNDDVAFVEEEYRMGS